MSSSTSQGLFTIAVRRIVPLVDPIAMLGVPRNAIVRRYAISFRLEPHLMDSPQEYQEQRRVLNLIQDRCDACKMAAWASLGIGERSEQW